MCPRNSRRNSPEKRREISNVSPEFAPEFARNSSGIPRHPFETPPLGPEIGQLLLPLPSLGQQARFETDHLVRKPGKPVQKTP